MKRLKAGMLVVCLFFPLDRAAADTQALAWGIAAQTIFQNTAALKDLRDPSGEKHYLLAGSHQFRTVWTRDFSFAVDGAMRAGGEKAVRDTLEILLAAQRPDGLLPRTVDRWNIHARVILGALGYRLSFKYPLKPWFETEYGVVAIDSNVVLPWAASRYVLASRDRAFAERWLPTIERAFTFLETGYFDRGLIAKQPPFSDWEDSVKRRGRVAFTNAVYLLALRGAGEWAEFLGNHEKALGFFMEFETSRRRFIEHFWQPERGVLKNFDGDARLTADANLLAVAEGLLDEEKARSVMKALRASPLWSPMPGRPTDPPYLESQKGKNVKLVGIAAYHDKMYWLWITALAAKAERAIGNCEGFESVMKSLSERIAKDGTVQEVFDLKKDGRLKPVKRVFYRSESPFTWSAALYLEAAAEARCDRKEPRPRRPE